jgi:hypothetical protein
MSALAPRGFKGPFAFFYQPFGRLKDLNPLPSRCILVLPTIGGSKPDALSCATRKKQGENDRAQRNPSLSMTITTGGFLVYTSPMFATAEYA